MEFLFALIITVVGMWLTGYVFYAASVAAAVVLSTPFVVAEKLLKDGDKPLIKDSPNGDVSG
mgnify:CR=1 FL=1